jgi:hypothetical protein
VTSSPDGLLKQALPEFLANLLVPANDGYAFAATEDEMVAQSSPRRLEIDAADGGETRKRFLPTQLRVLRPDGKYESEHAQLAEGERYSFHITHRDLDAALTQGRLRPAIDWVSEERADGTTGLRATHIHFIQTDTP